MFKLFLSSSVSLCLKFIYHVILIEIVKMKKKIIDNTNCKTCGYLYGCVVLPAPIFSLYSKFYLSYHFHVSNQTESK